MLGRRPVVSPSNQRLIYDLQVAEMMWEPNLESPGPVTKVKLNQAQSSSMAEGQQQFPLHTTRF
jgi:hypothetical protein